MGLVIHCPCCQAQLTVPNDAAGRMGRCPQCRQTFRVPDENSLIDETVGSWLEATLDEEPDDGDIPPPPTGRPVTPPVNDELPFIRRKPVRPAPAQPPPPPVKSAAASGVTITGQGKPVYAVRSAVRHGVTAEGDLDSPPPPRPEQRPVPRREPGRISGDDTRLKVEEVTAAGVTVGFHANLLQRPAFRASMPFCCVQCGDRQDRNLVARPLAWIDRAHGKTVSPGEIENSFAVHVKAQQTPREVLASMQSMEHFNAPFNEPVIYFVCQHCASHVSISCQTYMTPEGVQCQVIIPSGQYALEWVGRVNGIIGDDYQALEAQVHKFDSDDWRAVPAQVRQRLSAWFDFEPDEHFVAYFSDSDFPKKDAGLAGVILTSQRLVYCKFNNKGSVRLDTPCELILVPDGPFCNLFYQLDRQPRRMVRLRTEDAQRVTDLLGQLTHALNITTGEPAPANGGHQAG